MTTKMPTGLPAPKMLRTVVLQHDNWGYCLQDDTEENTPALTLSLERDGNIKNRGITARSGP